MTARVDFDVIAVGGGPAGIATAWAATRAGARCGLFERSNRLGGNAANAFVHTICGLYRAAADGDAIPLHPGLPTRIASALQRCDAAGAPERAGRVWVLPIEPPRFGRYAEGVCDAFSALEVRTGCELVEAVFSSDGIAALEFDDAVGGRVRATARIVVDASGDATAAALASADIAEADPAQLQLPSFIFRMGGVDRSGLSGFAKLRVTHALAGAARHGELPAGCESVLIRPAAEPDEVYVTLNVPRPEVTAFAPLEPKCLEAMTNAARSNAEQIAEYLRQTRPAFENSRVVAWPARMGVRETRRVAGRREIDRACVLEGRMDPDEVARSSWPIELWTDHRKASFEYPKHACSVPLGTLVSRSQPRLGMAGRCMSASHDALGALRVIGTALATGEAIGTAAALAADRGTTLDAIAAKDIRHHILDSADRGFPT